MLEMNMSMAMMAAVAEDLDLGLVRPQSTGET